MAQRKCRTVSSFHPDFCALAWKCANEGSVTLTFTDFGLAVNRAINIRSFVKTLRETPESELPEHINGLQIPAATMYVSGPGKNRNRSTFTVTLNRGDEPYFPEVTHYEPEQWKSRAATQTERFPGTHANASNFEPQNLPVPEVEMSDAKLWAIFQLRSPVYRLLSSAQRTRIEEMSYGMRALPDEVELQREIVSIKSLDNS